MSKVSHTTQQLVLSHARGVRLRLGRGAKMYVLARLIELPSGQPCFIALHLYLGYVPFEAAGPPLQPHHIQVLLDG